MHAFQKFLYAFRATLLAIFLVAIFNAVGWRPEFTADPKPVHTAARPAMQTHTRRWHPLTLMETDQRTVMETDQPTDEKVDPKVLAHEIAFETEQFEKYSVSFLLGTVIIFSFVFEFIHNRLLKTLVQRKMYAYIKIPRSLFKELAIFGFNGLALKILVNSGSLSFFEGIIVAYTQPCKEVINGLHKTAPKHLVEMFETVDTLIFMIMFMYVGIVLVMTLLSHLVATRWQSAEKKTLRVIQLEFIKLQSTTSWLNAWRRQQLLRDFEFHLLRREFFFPSPPIKAHKAVKPRDFRFSKFLGNCLTNLVVDMVDIPASCFLFLFFFVFAIQPLFWLDGVHLTMTLMFCPWVMLGCLIVIEWKMSNIYQWILPNTRPFYRPSANTASTWEGKVYYMLGDIPLDVGSFRKINTKPLLFDHTSNPLRRTENVFLKFIWGTSSPTAQQNLFWFKKNGPRVLLHFLQLLLFLTSVFCAVYLKFFIGEGKYPHLPRTFQCYVFMFFTLLPLAAMLLYAFPSVLMIFTIVQNTVQMRNERIIELTVNEIIDEQRIQYTKLISQLKLKGYVYHLTTCHQQEFINWLIRIEDSYQNTHEDEVFAMEELFRCYAAEDECMINKEELNRVLLAQGEEPHVAREIVDTWWQVWTRMAREGLVDDLGCWATPNVIPRRYISQAPLFELQNLSSPRRYKPQASIFELQNLSSPRRCKPQASIFEVPKLSSKVQVNFAGIEPMERGSMLTCSTVSHEPLLQIFEESGNVPEKTVRRKITTQYEKEDKLLKRKPHDNRFTRLQVPKGSLNLPRTNPILDGAVKLTEYNFYMCLVAMRVVEECRFTDLEDKIRKYLTHEVADGEDVIDKHLFFKKLPEVCRKSELRNEEDINELFKNVRGDDDDADFNDDEYRESLLSVETTSGGVLIVEITAWLDRFDRSERIRTSHREAFATGSREQGARDTLDLGTF